MASPEIQFAQRLASNEKIVRDRALNKLRKYIVAKTRRSTGGFSHNELLKIWKGLFYCLWMQDKPLLQEELAKNISALTHAFQNEDARELFLQTFFQTMNHEWNGIDGLRLDKFYMLMRFILRECFEVLKDNQWEERLMKELLSMIMTEVMSARNKAPRGVKFHFIDIYLQELAKVGAEELTAEQNLLLIDPFCKLAARTKDHLLMQAVIQGIFEQIVDQSPFAIEEIMKETYHRRDEAEDSVEELLLESKRDKDSTKPVSRQLNGEEEDLSLDGFEDQDNPDEIVGPVLQFDYDALAERLLELSRRKSTPAQNRKRLYRVVKKFQDLAEGVFPQDDFPEDVSTDEDDDEYSRGRRKKRQQKKALDKKEKGKKAAEKEKANREEIGAKKKKKKKKKVRIKGTVSSAVVKDDVTEFVVDCASENGTAENKQACKKEALQVTVAGQREIKMNRKLFKGDRNIHSSSSSSSDEMSDSSKRGKWGLKKKAKKKDLLVHMEMVEPVVENGHSSVSNAECSTAQLMRKEKVIKISELKKDSSTPGSCGHQEGGDSDSCATRADQMKCRRIDSEDFVVAKKRSGTKTKRKIKKEESDSLYFLNTKKQKQVSKLEEDFVKFEKSVEPSPSFYRKPKDSTSSLSFAKQLSTSDSGSKKVTFGLNRNMTTEFRISDESILLSPEGPSRVAFDPEQKPLHGVLKSPMTQSTYPKLKKKSVRTLVKRRTSKDFFQ
ncbi:ribosomal RNA processing protein 1 homolog A isoform X1 [Latimeria chalumnae]|uniref:ribosomal RNA processing protein 1 homolog A isoform X1 n=1 Tax=Latimeria chalumnae TaxID=7897 RepID=UPI00313C9CF4